MTTETSRSSEEEEDEEPLSLQERPEEALYNRLDLARSRRPQAPAAPPFQHKQEQIFFRDPKKCPKIRPRNTEKIRFRKKGFRADYSVFPLQRFSFVNKMVH